MLNNEISFVFSHDTADDEDALPWPLRRDGFAQIGENVSIFPIFVYRHAKPQLVYVDQPRLTEAVWAVRREDVFEFHGLEFDCADPALDKSILGDQSTKMYVVQLRQHVIDDLRGREYVGFVVAHSEIKSYIG